MTFPVHHLTLVVSIEGVLYRKVYTWVACHVPPEIAVAHRP